MKPKLPTKIRRLDRKTGLEPVVGGGEERTTSPESDANAGETLRKMTERIVGGVGRRNGVLGRQVGMQVELGCNKDSVDGRRRLSSHLKNASGAKEGFGLEGRDDMVIDTADE